MTTKCLDVEAFKVVLDKTQADVTELGKIVSAGSDPGTPPSTATPSGPWKMDGQADLWITRGTKPNGDSTPPTGTDVSGTVTFSGLTGDVTTASLVTVAGGMYALTIKNDKIALGDSVAYTVANGTNTKGTAVVDNSSVSEGTAIVNLKNSHASEALNGTVVLSLTVTKPATFRRR